MLLSDWMTQQRRSPCPSSGSSVSPGANSASCDDRGLTSHRPVRLVALDGSLRANYALCLLLLTLYAPHPN